MPRKSPKAKKPKANPHKDQDIDLLSGVFRKGVSALLSAGLGDTQAVAQALKRTGLTSPREVLLKTARRLATEDERVQGVVQLAAASSPALASHIDNLGLLVKDAEPVPPEDGVKDAEVLHGA